GPPATGDLLAADVASLAGLLVWLLCGREVQAGDPLPLEIPETLRSLLDDGLRLPETDRPTIGEFQDQLRQRTRRLQARAGGDATGAETTPPPAPPASERGRGSAREQLGRFRLAEKLGQGGMGEVYRAIDTSDGSVVAIKTLLPEYTRQPEAIKRFRKE